MPIQPRLVEVAIEAKSKADAEKLAPALAALAAADPRLEVCIDRESGQIILKGLGELHLDDAIDVLRRTYGIGIHVGSPQVAFREHITRPIEVSYTHKGRTGAVYQFAAVTLRVEPNEPGRGNRFAVLVAGDALVPEYIGGVEKGIQGALLLGVVAGFPVIDIKVTLIGSHRHDTDSSVSAFEIAARAALREALTKAKSVLLEPIMTVEVASPQDQTAAVIADLNLRRGKIRTQERQGDTATVSALVPLMNMFGYVNSLRTISRSATYAMRFDHYAPAPPQDDGPPFQPAIGMRG
jgi:elongation factor G